MVPGGMQGLRAGDITTGAEPSPTLLLVLVPSCATATVIPGPQKLAGWGLPGGRVVMEMAGPPACALPAAAAERVASVEAAALAMAEVA